MAESGIECRSYSSQARSLSTLLLSVWHLGVLQFVLDRYSDDSDSPHKGYINDRKKKNGYCCCFKCLVHFVYSSGPHAKMYPEDSFCFCFFLILLPLIKYKRH